MMVRVGIYLALAYAAIGVVLAIIMFDSYGWGVRSERCDGVFGQAIGEMRAEALGYWNAAVRFVTWAPSLIYWAVAGKTDESFWQWVAPGASEGCG